MSSTGAGNKRKYNSSMTKSQLAAMIGARTQAKWPRSSYGTMYVKRGTPMNVSEFGPTFAAANATQRVQRRTYGYTGRGLYDGRGMYTGRGGVFSDIGGKLGDLFGKGYGDMGKAGRNIGGVVDLALPMFGGRGLYTGRGAVSAPKMNEIMMGSAQRSAKIDSVADETGSICISNREYVGDIFAPSVTGGFDVQQFPLNPGLEQSFPWLAQLAANYEEYEFIQLVYEFKSCIQDVNSANGQVGTIICATDYNASHGPFTDKPSMVNAYGVISSKTTDDIIAGVECDPKKLSGSAGSYVRTNPVVTGEDLKGYDHGIFQLATHNIPAGMLNGTLGELFVVYKVVLRKPKLVTSRGLAITRALFVSGNGTESATQIMGTQAGLLTGQQNNLKVALDLSVANTIKLTFPAYYAGNVEIKIFIEGTSMAGNVLNGGSNTGNIVAIADMYAVGGATDSPASAHNLTTTTSAMGLIHYKFSPATNAVNNVVTITSNITGTVTQGVIDITEYNTAFNNANNAPILINNAGVVVVP